MGLLDGKVLIVSGVGPGLGMQVAVLAGHEGASVVVGARTADYVADVAAKIRAEGGVAAGCPCDITEADDCARLVALAVDRFGGLDSVVCNAYLSGPMLTTIEESDFDEWRPVFEVNLFGSLRVVQAALPALRARQAGSIVFVNSQIVRRVFAGRGPYASSKAALLTAAQVLAKELGPANIRVNSVVPGRMWGPAFEQAYTRWASDRNVTLEEELRPVREAIALPSIPTDAEVARTVLFLASDLSVAMTGQAVDVNGGETFH